MTSSPKRSRADGQKALDLVRMLVISIMMITLMQLNFLVEDAANFVILALKIGLDSAS